MSTRASTRSPRSFPPRWHVRLPSPLGELLVAASSEALAGLWYTDQAHPPLPYELGESIGFKELPPPASVEQAEGTEPAERSPRERAGRILSAAAAQLREYFEGKRRAFDIPLDPDGTDFQLIVWQQLRQIPSGYTATYGSIARAVGPGSPAQAVGQAVGHNKISIIIPCHRVIGSDGSLTGYAGGIERKKFLLALEEPSASEEGRLF